MDLLALEAPLFVFCSLPPPIDSKKQNMSERSPSFLYFSHQTDLEPLGHPCTSTPSPPRSGFWPPPPRLVISDPAAL